ncbi:hypothetical protein BC939DRAFT_468811 [Gamsiella multidivaricata]|uniref:uncharacterized protein n=1 Tax=Gamsiella multidivaricata TaxID=101098 RepID=UPI00221E6A42|nr:uncharacterized protein BC939DRAFT_468811 [Gamsiella multidivaricata]KAI7816519.1 hypothetical protein BC939DRAFT_468811 [Gamsiella multidivaricata]
MSQPQNLRVIIIGGGLAGLVMGIMLDRAGIDYHILEQASRLRPLGTSISLHPVIVDIMDQLGLLEGMRKMSKPLRGITVLSANGRKKGRIDARSNKRKNGHQAMVMSRPDLHEFLLSKIPAGKLTTGKRVIDISETQSDVTVTCMDETTYAGHLVVGADGAYSATRQIIYQRLTDQGLLPESDKMPLHFDKQCVVGMTCPLDPAKYPVLQDESCEVKVLLGKDQHTSMWILPLQGNRMAWCVGGPDPHLIHNDEDHDSDGSHSSRGRDWYPETAVEICEDVRNFKCPYGGSVMDLIEATPKGLVSKVLLEEKMYRTWYNGRVVLVGDGKHNNGFGSATRGMYASLYYVHLVLTALISPVFFSAHPCRVIACHKIVPFFGQGASQAILDCACLVNMLNELQSFAVQDLANVFEKYVDMRSETARVASDSSREFADLIYEQGFKADMARNIVLRFTPAWLLRMITGNVNTDRPSLNFLPPPKSSFNKP